MRAMEGCLRTDGEEAVAVGVSCLLPDNKEIAERKRSLLSSWALYLSRCDRRLRLLETPRFFWPYPRTSIHARAEWPTCFGSSGSFKWSVLHATFIYLFILLGYYKPHGMRKYGEGEGKVRLIQTLYLGSMFLL